MVTWPPTVQDTPVRWYGGLKDQDQIFTDTYLRRDHGIKGALVRCSNPLLITILTSIVSLVATGIGQKILSLKVSRVSFKRSSFLVCASAEVLVSKQTEVELHEQARLAKRSKVCLVSATLFAVT